MQNNINYKEFHLISILDAYVTKHAIEDFLSSRPKPEHSEFSKITLEKHNVKVNKYLDYLKNELEETDAFLDNSDSIYWHSIGISKELFDTKLPKHKRRLEWFRSVDRYPFDHSLYFNSILTENES